MGSNWTQLADTMWKTKCFNEAMKNNSSIISLDTLISIIIYSAVDHTECIAVSNSRGCYWHYSSKCPQETVICRLCQEVGYFLYYYQQQLLPSAFFFPKILTSYIPLCFVFVSFNVLCIVFVLIALLFTNNQTELCHALGMTRLLVQFLAKSEGLVFPLPYPEAGGEFWYFEHSKRRSNPETQFCTQGLGSG